MRLTLALCRINLRRMRNDMWKRKGYVKAIPATKPFYLRDKEIYDPTQPIQTEPRWEPAVPDAPQYKDPPTMKDHPDYHDEGDYIYEYHNKTRLIEGLKQACVLTKTYPMYELPQSVSDNIGVLEIPEQDMLVQRYIMQANIWDPTKEKLPRRINKRLPGWSFKAEYGIPERRIRIILMQNLVRLCQAIGGQYPDLMLSRTFLPDPYLSVAVNVTGNKDLMIRGVYDWMLASDRPLQPFASQEEVDNSATLEIPNLHPIAPTIDLYKQLLYKEGENITGFKSGFKFSHPHTMFLEGTKRFAPQEINGKMLMFAFGQCAAIAKARYGDNVGILDEPITVQVVLTDGTSFHFACFQLNTLVLDSSNGIKNMVWFDNSNAMYQKILPERAMLRNTRYEDYDPEVFRKILGFYRNGADLDRKWPVADTMASS